MKVKRHSMKDLPESDEAVAQWCKDIFVVKVSFCLFIYMYIIYFFIKALIKSYISLYLHLQDDVLDKHRELNTFPDSELVDIGRPLKSLVVTITTN